MAIQPPVKPPVSLTLTQNAKIQLLMMLNGASKVQIYIGDDLAVRANRTTGDDNQSFQEFNLGNYKDFVINPYAERFNIKTGVSNTLIEFMGENANSNSDLNEVTNTIALHWLKPINCPQPKPEPVISPELSALKEENLQLRARLQTLEKLCINLTTRLDDASADIKAQFIKVKA